MPPAEAPPEAGSSQHLTPHFSRKTSAPSTQRSVNADQMKQRMEQNRLAALAKRRAAVGSQPSPPRPDAPPQQLREQRSGTVNVRPPETQLSEEQRLQRRKEQQQQQLKQEERREQQQQLKVQQQQQQQLRVEVERKARMEQNRTAALDRRQQLLKRKSSGAATVCGAGSFSGVSQQPQLSTQGSQQPQLSTQVLEGCQSHHSRIDEQSLRRNEQLSSVPLMDIDESLDGMYDDGTDEEEEDHSAHDHHEAPQATTMTLPPTDEQPPGQPPLKRLRVAQESPNRNLLDFSDTPQLLLAKDQLVRCVASGLQGVVSERWYSENGIEVTVSELINGRSVRGSAVVGEHFVDAKSAVASGPPVGITGQIQPQQPVVLQYIEEVTAVNKKARKVNTAATAQEGAHPSLQPGSEAMINRWVELQRGKYKGRSALIVGMTAKKFRVRVTGVDDQLEVYPSMFKEVDAGSVFIPTPASALGGVRVFMPQATPARTVQLPTPASAEPVKAVVVPEISQRIVAKPVPHEQASIHEQRQLKSKYFGANPTNTNSSNTRTAATTPRASTTRDQSSDLGSATPPSSAALWQPAIHPLNNAPRGSPRTERQPHTSVADGQTAGCVDPIWLTDPRDRNGKAMGDKGYDRRTLTLPAEALSAMSETQRQFWEIKKDRFDTVILMKIGKFYETFGIDAHLCHRELGLSYMKIQGMAKVGFPGTIDAFSDNARRLVARGLKVARVEQVKGAGTGGVLKRSLIEVLSAGTIRLDEDKQGSYVLAVLQEGDELGLCFADCLGGSIYSAQFKDDDNYSTLSSLLIQLRPREVIHEIGLQDKHILKMVRSTAACVTAVDPFWTESFTTKQLRGYWEELPSQLQHVKGAALRAFGGVVAYLRSCLKDREVLCDAKVALLEVDRLGFSASEMTAKTMQLDGSTISALHLVEGEHGSTRGSLVEYLNFTKTPAGARMLRLWVSRPLCEIDAIVARQNMVRMLVETRAARAVYWRECPRGVDLERTAAMVQRWAQEQVEQLWQQPSQLETSRRLTKIINSVRDACSTFKALEALLAELPQNKQQSSDKSFEDLQAADRCRRALQALSPLTDHIEPLARDSEVVAASQRLKLAAAALEDHLTDVRAQLNDCNVVYNTVLGQKYVFEVQKASLSSCYGPNLPPEMMVVNSTKTLVRFRSETVAMDLFPKFEAASEAARDAMHKATQRWLQKFVSFRDVWRWLSDASARWDVLCALAEVSSRPGMCRPHFIQSTAAAIVLKRARHPMAAAAHEFDQFVPNDTRLGNGAPTTCLLTGPNMGGKSTYMRQVCLAVVMAQLGCYVAADKAVLSPVDRIFTRIGAHDKIFEGMSTFKVELQETQQMLLNATRHSMVVLDELGRGTSTFDGQAIAHAVVEHLGKLGCRQIFATHYHSLVHRVLNESSKWAAGSFMGFVARGKDRVVMTHRLEEGVVPSSFGVSVARMAGVPHSVLVQAQQRSAAFIEKAQHDGDVHLLRSVFRSLAANDMHAVRQIHSKLLS